VSDGEPEVHRVIGGGGPLVRRRIVVWRRLEPGDRGTPGARPVPESPFLEAKILEIGIPRAVHEDMKRLAAARARATAIPSTVLTDYEPAGILIAGAGGIMVGVWLEYLEPGRIFLAIGAVLLAIGVVTAMIAKRRRRRAEAVAAARWAAAPERSEYESLAHDLANGWEDLVQSLKRDSGFHTEIRVAEGSDDPLRLASIDPRPLAKAQGFDPEDWLPTEGGGVRYEAVHAAGEIATRLMTGVDDVAEPATDEGAPEERNRSAGESAEGEAAAGRRDGAREGTPRR
jgi:hypothetical protein